MEKPIIFMLSGQGSQFYGMGEKLFEHHRVFRSWMITLDDVIKKNIGFSIIDILYDAKKNKDDIFDTTLHTHISIFILEYALVKTLIQSGVNPDYILGASLGEIVAITLAEIISIEDAIAGLRKQAELLDSHCPAGSMLAIIEHPRLYNDIPFIRNNSELASINFDSHFVISGHKDKVTEIKKLLKEKNILSQLLPVSHGFHSSLMDPIAAPFKRYLATMPRSKSKIPIISALKCEVVTEIDNDHLWRVTREPVFFKKTIQELEEKALPNNNGLIFVDAGPSGTLSTFVKYIVPHESRSENYAIVSPFNNDLPNLEKIIKAIAKKQRLSYKNEVRKMTTYVFPGQGSQRKGMGAGLFDEFKEITARADAVLGYSIKELCLHDPDNQLDQTQYTQPVLYIVNSLMYLKKIQEAPGKPDYVAGHSLGEYCALFTAGAFNFETGLRLVQKRGELMGRVAGGGMAAVIGLDEDKIIDILNDNALSSISIANCNSPLQIVISGIKEDLIKARKIFEQAGAELYIPLKVSGAFHSPHMARVRDEFEKFLAPYNFSQLTIRVISNVHARPYQQSDIKKTLVEQITSPVRWSETIQYLMGCGEMDFVEVGPGEVLTGLIKRIRAESAQRVETKEKVKPDVIENDPEQKKPHEVRIATTPTARDKSLEGRPTEEGAISVESLGCREYKKDYNLKYAYVAGGMYRGIASKEMVIKLGKAGMMGYLGTGGVSLAEIQDSINCIQKELVNGEAFGMNLLNTILEEPMVDLYLKNGIKNIEASAYIQVSPALVRYRLKGLSRGNDGNIVINHKIMAKVSRPDVAEEFLRPAPEKIVKKLLEEKKITDTEAELAMLVAMADDICAEADSGGHTDGGVAYALIPAVIRLRDEMMKKYKYKKKIRVGAAGGIGTPEAAAAAFILEADFILTGSINQCTVEAGTSDAVKDLLQDINVQDTAYAPAGDMFEVGSKVQVLKKGVFFPMRANRLYELYRQHNSLEEIDENTKRQLEEKYFKRSLKEIFEGLTKLYPPTEIENASKNGKRKMALVFKWYFSNATELALRGKTENIVDFQVMCGPALGAFNQWVKGTDLESWKNRNVDKIGIKIMNEAAAILSKKLLSLTT